ncbi:MAG: hypothetical protein LBG84_03315 [Treponema sp.]|jgi:hypothetical protein|nr:hypothetical protein [Treponema sp.]
MRRGGRIRGSLTLVLVLLCAVPGVELRAQDLSLEELPALKDKAMVLRITTRIEENSQEVWNAYNSKITIPGRPVSIKLVGDNLVVAIQFTPYTRGGQGQNVLVAQGQIWVYLPDKGMSYKTTMHSMPMDFGEEIYYFPLGSNAPADNPRIELRLTLYRYGEEPEQQTAPTDPSPESAPAPAPGAPAEAKPPAKAPAAIKAPGEAGTAVKAPPEVRAKPETR